MATREHVSENAIPLVDLVIAIDTSESMKEEAAHLSQAAEAAIEATQAHCPSDLRVAWLGVEGTWKDTHFEQTLRRYLTETCKVEESAIRGRKRGILRGGGAQEDGARAIEDLSTHFNWREGAERSVFYLSDEGLEGGGSQVNRKDIEAADRAIKVASEAGVTVYTYFGKSRSRSKEALQREYARVAESTGGLAFTEQDSLNGFTTALENMASIVGSATWPP